MSLRPGTRAGLQSACVGLRGRRLLFARARPEQSAASLALSRCACATWRVRFLVGSVETFCPVLSALSAIVIVRMFSRGLGSALTRAAEVHASRGALLPVRGARGVVSSEFSTLCRTHQGCDPWLCNVLCSASGRQNGLDGASRGAPPRAGPHCIARHTSHNKTLNISNVCFRHLSFVFRR